MLYTAPAERDPAGCPRTGSDLHDGGRKPSQGIGAKERPLTEPWTPERKWPLPALVPRTT